MKKVLIIAAAVIVAAAAGVLLYVFVFSKNLRGQIALPYISHQKPVVDPHLPAADGVSDKLDEALFTVPASAR
jgi:flagellar basal body-associated protein FliL